MDELADRCDRPAQLEPHFFEFMLRAIRFRLYELTKSPGMKVQCR